MRARALITTVFMLVIVSSISAALVDDTIQLYNVYSYGGIVVATIDRSAFRYLGNGYWLLVLPDMDVTTLSSQLVNEIVVRFIGSRTLYSRLHIIVADDDYKAVKTTGIFNVSSRQAEVMNIVMQVLNISRAREAIVSLYEGNIVRIDVVAENRLDAEKIASRLSGTTGGYKIIIVETISIGTGLPSYFEAPELYGSLEKIPCYIGVGESFYGIDIWFNISCVRELATTANISFSEAVEDIVDSIKALNPLIRRYLPYQDIVIEIAQPPPPPIYLTAKPEPVETTKHTNSSPRASLETEYTSQKVLPISSDKPRQVFVIFAILVAITIATTIFVFSKTK